MVDRKWEFQQLPEDPSRMTFRGRYSHIDNYVAKLLRFECLPKGSTIRVLDFAGGVLPFGSPTAHDLYETVAGSGLNPQIVVVDKNIPGDLTPSYPEIEYRENIDGLKGSFDIVRMVHIIEHVPSKEYLKLRNSVINLLRKGGIFISSQELGYFVEDMFGRDFREYIKTIKVMQKVTKGIFGASMIPLSILPDSDIPWPGPCGVDVRKEHALKDYHQYRQMVRDSKVEIPLYRRERLRVLRALKYLSSDVLQYENASRLIDKRLLMPTNNPDILKQMRQNRKVAYERFTS